MKFGISVLAAGMLAFAVPLRAESLAPGEIMLHINAQGSVAADRARIEMAVSGEGESKEAAELALRKQAAVIGQKLQELGITPAETAISKPQFTESTHELWDAAAEYAPAEAAAGGADISPEYAVSDAVDAALAAVDDAADEQAWAPETVPYWAASATVTVTVTVEDLARLREVFAIASGEYGLGRRPQFTYRDEAKAQREAVAKAAANARAEAEIYADAMGYRVVRIGGVSNDGPPLSMPSVLQAIASIDNPAREWSLMGQKLATISVDFVMAPK